MQEKLRDFKGRLKKCIKPEKSRLKKCREIRKSRLKKCKMGNFLIKMSVK